jgi:ATP-dependent Lon protease
MERETAAICRKVARKVVEDPHASIRVTANSIPAYLGSERFRYGQAEPEPQVGAATGLAWTEVGGDILSIEVTTVSGKGHLTMTGQLGDVMKESAQAGMTYVHSRSNELGIPDDSWEKRDVHIHVPEGAIPKDGPSAGITMATALASALSGRQVRNDLAMTGEVTLRGRVLPVGGIKEKVLAAHRAGVERIILPSENKKDLEEVPDNVKRKMQFVLVSNMDEVLAEAFVSDHEVQ